MTASLARFVLLSALLTATPVAGLASDHADPAPKKAAKAEEVPAARLASAADTAPADPLDKLRQRLAERLSTGKAVETANPNDLRVVAKTASSAAAAATTHGAKAGGARTARAGDKAGADSHGPAHWDYNGSAGPTSWGALKPEFSLCGAGQRQSPIDIRGGLAVDLDPIRFEYQASRFAVVDNGHTVQVNLAPGNVIEVGGKRFELLQFHFHRPSEERIDGRQFEMSLHLVHKNEQGQLAVVALLFEKGSPQAVVQKVWNNLPLEKGQEREAKSQLELNDLLPADRRYFTYMGSLTTPPCSEGVQWLVMRQPVTVTPEQIEIFSRIYPMNARPIQSASGRRILQSN